jgi:predicted dehydrogenase
MIRAGIIGTGIISGTHLGYLSGRTDVKIEAVCDTSAESRDKAAAQHGARAFDNFETMLTQAGLDAVWLCTPPQVREAPLVACARRKLPVFCEKPVERSVERAAAITRALRELDARVQVGYVFRSMPLVARLRDEVSDDTIRVAQSWYGCPISRTMSLPPWFYDKSLSGGALADQATHNFDLLRCLFGEVEQVVGIARNPVHPKAPGYTVDECISIGLAFRSGLVCSHAHTWAGDAWHNELYLGGEKRRYRVDLTRGTLLVEEGSRSWSFEQTGPGMYTYENEAFLSQVASGDWSRNPCSYEDGCHTLKLTQACERAVETGSVVSVS